MKPVPWKMKLVAICVIEATRRAVLTGYDFVRGPVEAATAAKQLDDSVVGYAFWRAFASGHLFARTVNAVALCAALAIVTVYIYQRTRRGTLQEGSE